jgi:hypothetical protein
MKLASALGESIPLATANDNSLCWRWLSMVALLFVSAQGRHYFNTGNYRTNELKMANMPSLMSGSV